MPRSALYSLFMQAPALICVLRGSDLVFDLVNPLYQRLFPKRELLGRPIREALPELKGQGGLFELLDRVHTTGEPFTGKEVPVSLDRDDTGVLQEGFFNFTYQRMLLDDGQDGVIVFGFEVTDQVLARREANLLAEDLRKTNREKDEFIAVVAHELRTPMTSILGWVRLLRLGDLDDATKESALEALERSTKAQAKIIEDLLDESRIASGKLRLELRPLSLAPIVQSAVQMMQSAAEGRRTMLVTRFADEPLEMFGDPIRLQQVIANVLANAIKFSPEESHVEIRLSRDGARAVIEVQDHGRGIAQDLLPHVFDRFRQGGTTERQAGLGLGLAIARHLIELQGGTITATSEGEGKGAVFTMRLPLRTDEEVAEFAPRDDRERVAAFPSLKGVHVLVVEDNVDNRAVIAAVMERCGATVECATTAAEGLRRVAQRTPDVIIVDIVLPDLDGCAFLQQVRSAGGTPADAPALALTVFGRAHEQERIVAAGFDALRQKPIEPADLANEVERLVGKTVRT
ncbi:MAG: ATP-binding protein, partial [Thermoanaerobaculia bacterium]